MMSSSSSSLGCVHTWWLFIKEYFMKLSVVVGRRGRVILLDDDFFALPLCLSPPFTFIDSSSPQMNIMMTSLCLGPQILSASEQARCCCCKKKSCSSIHKKSFGFVCRNTQVLALELSTLFEQHFLFLLLCIACCFWRGLLEYKRNKNEASKNAKNNTLDDDSHWRRDRIEGGLQTRISICSRMGIRDIPTQWELGTTQDIITMYPTHDTKECDSTDSQMSWEAQPKQPEQPLCRRARETRGAF